MAWKGFLGDSCEIVYIKFLGRYLCCLLVSFCKNKFKHCM